jgi:methyltransferase
VWLAERPFAAAQFWGFGGLVVLTMSLRYWVIATLGDRWNPQIVVVPDDVRITGGPFRYLPHPNYLAVVVELFALPMMHGAWGVAITYGVANGVLLRTRVLEEERVLQAELRTA